MSQPQYSPHRFNVIGCIIVLCLQIGLAPHIAILSVVPNLGLVFTIILALRSRPQIACVYAFLLGLFADIFSTQPLGASAIIFTIVAFIVAQLGSTSFCENFIGRFFTAIVAVILGQILFAIILSLVGTVSDVYNSLLLRVLPGTAYNALLAAVFSFLYRKIPGQVTGPVPLRNRLPKI